VLKKISWISSDRRDDAMSDVVIRVEHLSKEYRLGTISHGTLYHDLQSGWARFRGKEDPNTRIGSGDRGQLNPTNDRFCALKDISFDVCQGDIVGIIGRNGAGKSTLLKIISRVTAPTKGSIRIRGRVASLLEVGTGFHPELTGSENIFLNGAILGMRKNEIEQKFEEIVRFSEIDKFIDTPVKRYSSGMYVRLAFAVAAHLEPEILLVDEVLAVGDAQFQKKCLGKMDEVAKEGRTVLFVSHQMGAIQKLCTGCLLLENGKVKMEGPVEEVIDAYLNYSAVASCTPLAARTDRSGDGAGRLTALLIDNHQEHETATLFSGDTVRFLLRFNIPETISLPVFNIGIYNKLGTQIVHCNTMMAGLMPGRLQGEGEVTCEIPRIPLPPGHYRVNVALGYDGGLADRVENAASLDVLAGDFYGTGHTSSFNSGICLVDHHWSLKNNDPC
jgi:lipopolysaccharide transport system ATP-binding protein